MLMHWLGIWLVLLCVVCAVLGMVQQRRRYREESDRWFGRAVGSGSLGMIILVPLIVQAYMKG